MYTEKYESRRRGNKKGYHKGSFGSLGINIPKKETGRGHTDVEALNKAKDFLRLHPEGVSAIQVANYVGTSQARATRLLDLLSGNSDDNSFLVFVDDDDNNPLYYIYKDEKNGGA